MATKHLCDICGAEVFNRYELWSIEIQLSPKMGGMPDGRWSEHFEVCKRCKDRAYIALMEGTGR